MLRNRSYISQPWSCAFTAAAALRKPASNGSLAPGLISNFNVSPIGISLFSCLCSPAELHDHVSNPGVAVAAVPLDRLHEAIVRETRQQLLERHADLETRE